MPTCGQIGAEHSYGDPALHCDAHLQKRNIGILHIHALHAPIKLVRSPLLPQAHVPHLNRLCGVVMHLVELWRLEAGGADKSLLVTL